MADVFATTKRPGVVASELDDDEFYARDAQRSGLFDRMPVHLPAEIECRIELAAVHRE